MKPFNRPIFSMSSLDALLDDLSSNLSLPYGLNSLINVLSAIKKYAIIGNNGTMHMISVRNNVRMNQAGTSANMDMPPLVNIFWKYSTVHCWVAGDHPARQMCSIQNDKPNAAAHTNQIPTAHRSDQNSDAMGVRKLSLYAVDLKIFKPLPLPPADKILNFSTIVL